MSRDQQEGELNEFDELLRKRRDALEDENDDPMRGCFEVLDALISTSEACRRGLVRVEVGNSVRRIYVGEKEVCRFHHEGAHIALVVPDRIGGIGMRMTANGEDALNCIANLVEDAQQEAGSAADLVEHFARPRRRKSLQFEALGQWRGDERRMNPAFRERSAWPP